MKFSWQQITLVRVLMVLFWLCVLILAIRLPHFISLLPARKTITIFTWPRILDTNYLRAFEKETGIKLYVNYYETNEELLSKIRATNGYGYDLFITTDYTVSQLIKDGLIKPIDKNKFTFYQELLPSLLNKYHDPGNRYSIPYFWSFYGLGINKEYFGNALPPATWGLIFDPSLIHGLIGMTNYPREAILITAQYLFGTIETIDQGDNLEQITKTLIDQKKYVAAYTDEMAEELLQSKAVAVAVGQSADIIRMQRDNPHIGFVIPKEGSFISLESIVISEASINDSAIYKFLNYLYRPDIMTHHSQKFAFCPPTKLALKEDFSQVCSGMGQLRIADFFRNVISAKQINQVWIQLMGA